MKKNRIKSNSDTNSNIDNKVKNTKLSKTKKKE